MDNSERVTNMGQPNNIHFHVAWAMPAIAIIVFIIATGRLLESIDRNELARKEDSVQISVTKGEVLQIKSTLDKRAIIDSIDRKERKEDRDMMKEGFKKIDNMDKRLFRLELMHKISEKNRPESLNQTDGGESALTLTNKIMVSVNK